MTSLVEDEEDLSMMSSIVDIERERKKRRRTTRGGEKNLWLTVRLQLIKDVRHKQNGTFLKTALCEYD